MLPTSNASPRRRSLIAAMGAACLVRPMHLAASTVSITVGTTPVFLDDQIGLLRRWRELLASSTGRSVAFVQRGSYREIVELLLSGRIDAAWICGFPYVLHAKQLRLIAVPRYEGAPLYRSYLIVPSGDSVTHGIDELSGRVFAYSDPLSNSGFLVPRAELRKLGVAPEAHFRRTFFTYGHRKIIEAVAAGVAEAGAVDGYVWDTLTRQHPALTSGTRVAWRSPPYGFPPLVARAALEPETFAALQSAFVGMSSSPEGFAVLERLNLEGFEIGDTNLFNGIRGLVALAAVSA